jgi:hypothetical protein
MRRLLAIERQYHAERCAAPSCRIDLELTAGVPNAFRHSGKT